MAMPRRPMPHLITTAQPLRAVETMDLRVLTGDRRRAFNPGRPGAARKPTRSVEGGTRVERTDQGLDGSGCGWKERLVDEAGRAVRAGWAQTARLMALLAVAAAAVALIALTSR